jgi:hypothetical protein
MTDLYIFDIDVIFKIEIEVEVERNFSISS